MAYELLNAILNAQNSIPTPDLTADYNQGKQIGVSNQDLDEKSKILGSRDETEQMLASGNYQGALQNAQANGDTESANNILNRINQNNNTKASVAQRLLAVPQAQRASVLQNISPTLQQQGIDPSGMQLDDDSLGAMANVPVSSGDQQKLTIAGIGAQTDRQNANSNTVKANAEWLRQQIEAHYKPYEVSAKLQDSQAHADDTKNKTGQLQLNVWDKTHPILNENQVSNVNYNKNGNPIGLPNITMPGQPNTSTSPYTQGYGNRNIPLPSMTLAESEQTGNRQIQDTKGQIGQGNLGTSASGLGQFINSTRRAAIKQAFGLNDNDANNVLLTPEVQSKVLGTQVSGILGSNTNHAKQLKSTFASLQNVPDNILNSMDRNGVMKLVSAGENGHPLSDDEITAGDNLTTAPTRANTSTSASGSEVTSPNSVVRQQPTNDAVDPTNPQDTSSNTQAQTPSPSSTPNPAPTNTQTPNSNPAPSSGLQTSINGRPILYDNNQKQEFSWNGGGMAYIPVGKDQDGEPIYSAINVKKEQPTADQSDSLNAANRMTSDIVGIKQLIADGFDPTSAQAQLPLLKGANQTALAEKIRRFNEYANDLAATQSRVESGAAIGEEELKRYQNALTPKYGDSPEVVAQKLDYASRIRDGFRQKAFQTMNEIKDPKTEKELKNFGIAGQKNDIISAYESKSPEAISAVNAKYPMSFVKEVMNTQIKTHYISNKDYDKLVQATKDKDTNTLNDMTSTYGRDVIGNAIRYKNLRS